VRVADVWANYWTAEFFSAYPPIQELYDRVGISARSRLGGDELVAEFVGLKILPLLYDLPPSDAAYYPLYAECVELEIPVLVLTGHTAVLRPNETGRPCHLDDVALFFPELTIVAGHAGHPWADELLGLAWKHERLFVDTSGHRPKHFSPQLLQFMRTYGADKVLFGTGWPMMDPALLLDDVAGLGFDDEVTERFLWSNAAAIWGWS
jgi:predicted TIM-barrel fold metal-dependent hydrolase